MSEKKVVKFDNLPTRLPVSQTLLTWLAMDFWNFPSWAKGCLWTLISVLWIGSVINVYREKYIDIFEGK